MPDTIYLIPWISRIPKNVYMNSVKRLHRYKVKTWLSNIIIIIMNYQHGRFLSKNYDVVIKVTPFEWTELVSFPELEKSIQQQIKAIWFCI